MNTRSPLQYGTPGSCKIIRHNKILRYYEFYCTAELLSTTEFHGANVVSWKSVASWNSVVPSSSDIRRGVLYCCEVLWRGEVLIFVMEFCICCDIVGHCRIGFLIIHYLQYFFDVFVFYY